MWCEQCKTDVATQMSADGLSLLCTTCGELVQKVSAPSQHPETKSAREFLERWAREQQATRRVVQPVTIKSQSTSHELNTKENPSKDSANHTQPNLGRKSSDSANATTPSAVSASVIPDHVAQLLNELPQETQKTNAQSASSERSAIQIDKTDSEEVDVAPPQKTGKNTPLKSEAKVRFDGQHATPPQSRKNPLQKSETSPHFVTAHDQSPEISSKSASEDQGVHNESEATEDFASAHERTVRMDHAHQLTQGPHYPLSTGTPLKAKLPGRIEAIWGQILAYLGVGILTVGTALVLWGYFGDIVQYSSTGWLIATCGQMLLLLGIVTLVGGGMQQTTHEVSQRIEHLGGRIIRIEQSTDRILSSPIHRRDRRRPSDENREAA